MKNNCILGKLEMARLELHAMIELNYDKESLLKQSQILDELILEEMKRRLENIS